MANEKQGKKKSSVTIKDLPKGKGKQAVSGEESKKVVGGLLRKPGTKLNDGVTGSCHGEAYCY